MQRHHRQQLELRYRREVRGPKVQDVVHTKEKLVDEMESNDFNPNDSDLRRGDNVIQGLISNKKRKRDRTPITPLRLKMILEGSPGDEENTEGSDSDSSVYNPT